ncbi:hypothetical protein B0H16DRAFT_1523192 [Mycena metata]|uniref:CCHC-type domain-containing protein n=1 Tax=Mycena metata TaxID=1033252 RepID=A0AAD7JJI5_9AGAR|nr:hypothetical protein B0H16DRAFT_1523192 [Mycena metata]
MLAALRVPARQVSLRVAAATRAGAVSVPRSVNARTLSTEVPPVRKARKIKGPTFFICMNCRREGHHTHECKEPVICRACGVEGHPKGACPNPDPARLEALKNEPKKCFRCGEAHELRTCPQPAKCYHCGSTEHQRTACPTYVPKTPDAKAEAKAAA